MIPQALRTRPHKSAIRSTTRRGARRRKWPWSFERLEDRALLATFTVNSLLDTVDANPGNGIAQDAAGLTTLRAAIMEANALAGDDTITLSAGTYNLTRNGAEEDGSNTGDLDVQNNGTLTIMGAGVASTFIDAHDIDRIFHVPANASLNVSSLTFQNGNASNGGAILNFGTLNLSDSVFASNTAASSGGAIWSVANSTTVISGSTFNGNSAGSGGAIRNDGGMSISNSTVSGNSTTSQGGGIYNNNGSLTISNSTLSGNSTGFGGGGIDNQASLSVVNSTIIGNSYGNSFGLGSGGGVRLIASATFHNTIVAGNSGAVCPDVGGTLSSSSTNNLIGNGSGLVGITHGTNGNQIGTAGIPIDPRVGALADNGGPTMTHALLADSPAIDRGNNTASPTADQRGIPRLLDGDHDGTAVVDIGAYERALVVDTLADETDGNFSAGDLSLREAISRANLVAGPDFIEFVPALVGGTIILTLGELGITSDLTITGLGATQLAVSGNNASRVFHVFGTSTVSISRITITSGRASGNFPNNHGAGILNESGTLTILDSRVAANSATSVGGGIYSSGNLTIHNSTFSENSGAGGGAGALYATTGRINISNSTFTRNSAVSGAFGDGGAVVNHGDMTVTNSTFSDNVSGSKGGAIWNGNGNLILENATITGNSAAHQGGGIWNGGLLRLGNTIVAQNTAPSGPDGFERGFVSIGSLGHNLIGNADSFGLTAIAGDQFGTSNSQIDARLGPLADNGGSTLTHVLFPGSPAIDAGNNAAAPATDQRGITRPRDGNADGAAVADVGAYEREENTPPSADAGGPYTVEAGMDLHLFADGSSDPDAATGDQIIRYEWDLDNDGTIIDIDTSTPGTVVPWETLRTLGLGVGTHTIALRVTDIFGSTDSANTTVTIEGTLANDQSVSTPEDTAIVITLTAADFEGDALTFSIVAQPSRGTLSGTAPNLTYTPAAEYDGPDSFTFKANDGQADSNIATVSINVTSVTDTFIVDTFVDENDGNLSSGDFSLREAIARANVGAGLDIIQFDSQLVGGTITLTMGALAITSNVTVSGLGADQLAVSGNNASRIFNVAAGTTVDISGLTIRNGRAEFAGGILNDGTLAISDSVLSGNSTSSSLGSGGGILNRGSLSIDRSTIVGNSAVDGGGISNGSLAQELTITNSTVSGNSAFDGGGGIYNGTQIGTLAVVNSTISSNSANRFGGGIRNATIATRLTLQNTIVAGNIASILGPDLQGVTSSHGNNLIGNTSGSGGWIASDLQNVDARLGPLADNGGPTRTHALLAGSPAIDGGNNTDAPATDQRGFSRIADGADPNTTQTIDIGAFEAHPSIEEIADKSTDVDTPLSFSFNVGDAALGIDSVTASSSNATLVPNTAANLNLGGSGSTRTLGITPATGETGTSTITVTVTAGGKSMTDTFVLTVNAVNDVPVANPQTITTDEDEAVSVTLSGSDANGDALTFSITAQPLHGTLSGAAPNLTYTPHLNYHGPDAFDFTVSDGQATSAAATVSITVVSVNDAPVAHAGGPYTVEAGMNLHIFADGSSDPDAGDEIVRYEWDLNNDGAIIDVDIDTSTPNTVVPWETLQTLGLGLGTHTIALRVTDSFGIDDSATTMVTIEDTTPPELTVPAAITAEATSPQGGTVPIPATATDNGPGAIAIANDSPSVFPLGTTTVTVTATDSSGNQSTGTVAVTVVDTTPPILVVPADITVEATSAAGAVVTFTATATDAVTVSPAIAFSPASGSQFPLGMTTVTVTATDTAGNVSSASFDVTIVDTTPPVLVVPSDVTVEATTPAGAIVTFAATATDAVDPQPTISYSHASGSQFPLGETSIMVTATDDAGNSSTDTFKVFVIDTTGPAITLPPDQTFEATSAAGAMVTFNGATTPGETTTITYSPTNGAQFALGMTTVLVTATDTVGNSSTGTFKVIVVDTTPPVLTAPNDITVEATSAAGATATFVATATDAVTNSPTISFSPASGSQFVLGMTTVTVAATDAAGNVSSASFKVNVVDTTPPALTVPADITVEATSAAGAVVTFAATATDAVDPQPTITYSHASGSLFALGETTITVTATDDAGNTATGAFKVFVIDTTGPAITLPPDQTFEATSAAGAIVTFIGATTPGETTTITYSPANGSQFLLGMTTVLVTATDPTGNSSTGTFRVFVLDTTPPVLTAPADFVVEATSAAGATATFAATATDTVDPQPVITYSRTSGAQFAIGETTVTVTATDGAGNSSQASFEISVIDTTAPVLTVPADITADATSAAGALVTFSAAATDVVDSAPTLSLTHASGSLFPIGVTVVTVTATDDAGNQSAGDFTVTVVDTTPSGGVTTVNVIGGQLIIEGTGGDDTVSVTGIGTGTGVYTITTAQGTQTVSGVTGGISINLGGGNDNLVLNNVYVALAIDIQTGDGNDTLVLGNNDVVSSGGELRIDLGAGDDTLDGKRLYIGTNQIINAGDGNDRLIFDGFATPQFTLGTSAAGNATWIGGAGNDVVHVVYGFIVGGWVIELGAGSDLFDVFGSAASGDVQIFGRGGSDWLRVDTNFFDANLVMEGNDGGGLLFLANGLGTETAILSAGNGDDAVTVRNQTTSRVQIETGAGGDSVDVRASALDRLFAQLGDGNDQLTVHGNLSRFESRFDGGLGNGDLLRDLGNSFQSIYDKLGFEGFA